MKKHRGRAILLKKNFPNASKAELAKLTQKKRDDDFLISLELENRFRDTWAPHPVNYVFKPRGV